MRPLADHREPYSPQRHGAHFDHRLHLAGECHFHRSLAELFRPGDAAAQPVLGADAQQHRAGLYGAGALARHLSRPGYQPGGPGLQSLWGYATRYLGSQAARTELKGHHTTWQTSLVSRGAPRQTGGVISRTPHLATVSEPLKPVQDRRIFARWVGMAEASDFVVRDGVPPLTQLV